MQDLVLVKPIWAGMPVESFRLAALSDGEMENKNQTSG
jgi:hypothetical protein